VRPRHYAPAVASVLVALATLLASAPTAIAGIASAAHPPARPLDGALDNTPAPAPSGPAVPHSHGSVVVVAVYDAFVSHNTTSTIVNGSVPFPTGPFSRISVTFFDTYVSNPFDTSFVVEVNGTQLLAGNTLENENTSVTENVTEYYALFNGTTSVLVTCPQFNPGYASSLSAWFTFYYGPAPPHASVVLPAVTNRNLEDTGTENPIPVDVTVPYNVSYSTNVTFPSHVSSGTAQLFEQQNGNDEFWYTLQPPFREFRVFINGTLLATVQPYPNIQTGGGDLFLWQPILAIGADLYPPTTIDLTPFLGLLHGTQPVEVEVINNENLWIRVALNFLLNTSAGAGACASLGGSFQFVDHYDQSPATNATTLSIPTSTSWLNDSESTFERTAATGGFRDGAARTLATTTHTVAFFANSTEFDPLFDLVAATPYGPALYYEQNFSLEEYLNTTTTTTTSFHGGSEQPHGASSFSESNAYYSVSGSEVEAIILSTGDLLLGFSVRQVEIVSSYARGDPGGFSASYSSIVVNGSGEFVGVLTSVGSLESPLVSNQAYTAETMLTSSTGPGHSGSFFYLREIAVNNSLVNRNGTIIFLREY
jgi:hypothetical protein